MTSGLIEIQGILKGIPGISFQYLTLHDVVRHPWSNVSSMLMKNLSPQRKENSLKEG